MKEFSKKKKLFLIVGLSVLLATVLLLPLFGQSLTTTNPSQPSNDADLKPSEINLTLLVIRTFGSLVLVLVLLGLTIYGIRWLQKKSRSTIGNIRKLGVVDSLSLGPKKSVHLVKIMDRVLVIGVAENSMSFLTELSRDEADQFLHDPAGKQQLGFTSMLANQIDRMSRGRSR